MKAIITDETVSVCSVCDLLQKLPFLMLKSIILQSAPLGELFFFFALFPFVVNTFNVLFYSSNFGSISQLSKTFNLTVVYNPPTSPTHQHVCLQM